MQLNSANPTSKDVKIEFASTLLDSFLPNLWFLLFHTAVIQTISEVAQPHYELNEGNWTLQRKSHISTTPTQLNSELFHPQNEIFVFCSEFYCTHGSEQHTPCVLQRSALPGAVTGMGSRTGKGMLFITLTPFHVYCCTVSECGRRAGHFLQLRPAGGQIT